MAATNWAGQSRQAGQGRARGVDLKVCSQAQGRAAKHLCAAAVVQPGQMTPGRLELATFLELEHVLFH